MKSYLMEIWFGDQMTQSGRVSSCLKRKRYWKEKKTEKGKTIRDVNHMINILEATYYQISMKYQIIVLMYYYQFIVCREISVWGRNIFGKDKKL